MVRKEKPTKFATASRRKIEHNLETIVLNRIKHQQTKVPLGRKKLPAGKGKHIKKKKLPASCKIHETNPGKKQQEKANKNFSLEDEDRSRQTTTWNFQRN